ncbi:nuclear transport factor 2 family protein [Roseibium porphyridii]|uniref:Nuclear transport factor 2 family protein n=1 Tax=Roseibium porphyridii TaxID=2866279 RepID=A0ABY8F4Y4_9HYPH|nr:MULTISPECIES: nuclear transport factor 2 family protein [Stappiaceae]QFT33659.1 putative PhzA/B-like protein [Labrenzia sp. THAF82]WFE88920.1 nuclear transport factor 2 family protein [Roseibium sp. KMA01]
MTTQQPQLTDFAALLRKALGDALKPGSETLLDMVCDEIVFEFPYAPEGAIRRLDGKAALARYLPRVGKLVSLHTLALHQVTANADHSRFVVEFSCTGESKVTASRYDQDYISVIELRDGLISTYKDYWNPLVVLAAAGSTESLRQILQNEMQDER